MRLIRADKWTVSIAEQEFAVVHTQLEASPEFNVRWQSIEEYEWKVLKLAHTDRLMVQTVESGSLNRNACCWLIVSATQYDMLTKSRRMHAA